MDKDNLTSFEKLIVKIDSRIFGSSLSVIFSLISFFIIIVFMITSQTNESLNKNKSLKLSEQQDQIILNLQNKIVNLQNKIDYIERKSNSNITITKDSTTVNYNISILKVSYDSLEKRFEKIESIILKDPGESLEIPLLKRDIEDINTKNETKFENLAKDVERAYNIILASLASLAVGVFAPALSSLIQSRKAKNKDEQQY